MLKIKIYEDQGEKLIAIKWVLKFEEIQEIAKKYDDTYYKIVVELDK